MEIGRGGGEGERSKNPVLLDSGSLLSSVRERCFFGLEAIRGGGEGERPKSNFSVLALGDLPIFEIGSAALVGVSSTSSTVVESASLEVFRFNRTGDNDRGEDGNTCCPFPFVSSAMSNFDRTLLRGGNDEGLGLAAEISESSGDIPRP